MTGQYFHTAERPMIVSNEGEANTILVQIWLFEHWEFSHFEIWFLMVFVLLGSFKISWLCLGLHIIWMQQKDSQDIPEWFNSIKTWNLRCWLSINARFKTIKSYAVGMLPTWYIAKFVSLRIFYHIERQAYQHIAVDPSLFSYGTLHVLVKPFNTNIYINSHYHAIFFLAFPFFKCFCIFLIFSP